MTQDSLCGRAFSSYDPDQYEQKRKRRTKNMRLASSRSARYSGDDISFGYRNGFRTFGASDRCDECHQESDWTSLSRHRPEKSKSAFERIVELVSVRDRAEKELEDRLRKEGYSSEEVTSAIKHAVECNLVDNIRFAEAFIRGLVARGKGSRFIQRELSKYHIATEHIPGWPEEFIGTREEEISRAVHALNLHPIRSKNKQAAAYRRLVSRGFTHDVIQEAIDQWNEYE